MKYIRTLEHTENLRLARMNSPKVQVHIQTMNARKKGIPLSAEHRAKIGAAGVGRKKSAETRAKIGAKHKGKVVSLETRQKMSATRKGEVHAKGMDSPSWLGSKIGYSGLHQWVRKNKERTNTCLFCNQVSRTHFANISGEYLRDLDDFMELCISCHHKYDDVHRKIWETRRKNKEII